MTTSDIQPPGLAAILAIGAHPDDVFLGIGGYLLQLADRGHKVTMLTVTSGELGGNAHGREVEEREAAALAGFDLKFGYLADGGVNRRDAIRVIEAVIADVRPTIVFTHGMSDTHQDHVEVHHSSVVACRRVPNLLSYESPSAIAFRPNLTVDVTSTWDRKIAALTLHQSQMVKRPFLLWADAAGRFRAWPRHVGAYCEGLQAQHGSLELFAPAGDR